MRWRSFCCGDGGSGDAVRAVQLIVEVLYYSGREFAALDCVEGETQELSRQADYWLEITYCARHEARGVHSLPTDSTNINCFRSRGSLSLSQDRGFRSFVSIAINAASTLSGASSDSQPRARAITYLPLLLLAETTAFTLTLLPSALPSPP